MGLFRDKRNEAAALPLPQSTTIQNYGVSRASEIMAGAVAIVALVCAAWLGVNYAYAQIDEKMANTYTAFTFLCPGVLFLAAQVFVIVLNAFYRNHTQLVKTVKELDLELADRRLLAAQASPTGALPDTSTDANYTKMRLALAVLEIAYRECKNGERPYGANDKRPWVRDNAYSLDVAGVTVAMAGGLATWMNGNGLLRGNQVNFDKYPTWEDARRMLARRYRPAILLNDRPTLPDETTSIIDD